MRTQTTAAQTAARPRGLEPHGQQRQGQRAMKSHSLALVSAAAMAALCLAAPALARDKAAYAAPKTAFGQPDLEGTWTNATLTPFTRDKAAYGSRLTMTPEEAAKIEKTNDAAIKDGLKPTDPKLTIKDLPVDCGRGFKGVDCGYNSFWTDPGTRLMRINGEPRTSIVVEPADGQMPAFTPEGAARAAQRFARGRGNPHAYDNPENRSLGERCITSFGSSAGPPMLPLLYNNNYQIVQAPDQIAIVVEMVHDTRIIKLNGQHQPAGMRSWMGDSVGRWEGDTLVVETTNIRPEQALFGIGSDQFTVVERFTRIAPDKIFYQWTVTDPKTFKAPMKGEETLSATKGPVYEYACHEGNYALGHILAGARAKEKAGLPYDEEVKAGANGLPLNSAASGEGEQ